VDDERNTDGLTTFGGAIMHARTLARERATYRDARQIKQEGQQFSSVIPHSSDCSSSAAFNRDATFVCVGC